MEIRPDPEFTHRLAQELINSPGFNDRVLNNLLTERSETLAREKYDMGYYELPELTKKSIQDLAWESIKDDYFR